MIRQQNQIKMVLTVKICDNNKHVLYVLVNIYLHKNQ